MTQSWFLLVVAFAGCTNTNDLLVAVRVNADAHVCVSNQCGDALIWGPFETLLPQGTYPVRADAKDVFATRAGEVAVDEFGPNIFWADFAHGEFHFGTITVLVNDLSIISANGGYLGLADAEHPLRYWFVPRSYQICAETISGGDEICDQLEIQGGEDMLLFLAHHS